MYERRGFAIVCAAALFAYLICLYPAVLSFTKEKGWDAPIYWEAARGNLEYAPGPGHSGWAYSDRILPVLKPLGHLPYWLFLLVLHLLNSLGVCAVLYRAVLATGRCPVLGWLCAAAIGYFASDMVSGGNVTGILGGLAITPVGAVAVCCVKPWFGVPLLVVHAVSGAGKASG